NGKIKALSKEELAIREAQTTIEEQTTPESELSQERELGDGDLLELLLDMSVETASKVIENANVDPLALPTANDTLKWKSGADKRFRGAYTGDSKANVNKKKARLEINTDPSKPENRLMTDFITVSKPAPI
ncbi:hypothetical protein ABG067_008809, partial [Albugo candida]